MGRISRKTWSKWAYIDVGEADPTKQPRHNGVYSAEDPIKSCSVLSVILFEKRAGCPQREHLACNFSIVSQRDIN